MWPRVTVSVPAPGGSLSAIGRALGILQPSPDGSIPLIGMPLQFDGERPPFRRAPPALGEGSDLIHTDQAEAPKKAARGGRPWTSR